MKLLGQGMFNHRPLPCLLPQERENSRPSLSKTHGWIRRTVILESRIARTLFPLPGGEVQGEGECSR